MCLVSSHRSQQRKGFAKNSVNYLSAPNSRYLVDTVEHLAANLTQKLVDAKLRRVNVGFTFTMAAEA